MSSKKPEFKKVTGDKKSSKATPVTSLQMDQEVGAMIEEAKKPVTHLLTDPPQLPKDHLYYEPPKEVKPEPKPAPKIDRRMVRELRKGDRSYNHTCAVCLTRQPIEDFYRGKKDDICIACGGK